MGIDRNVVPMVIVIHSKAHEEEGPISSEYQSLSVLLALSGRIICSY